MDITYREFTIPSASGEGDVFARSWVPQTAPRAIVQIAHGMLEHAGRYDRFARYLAGEGYAVCANDHLGHGRSSLGHMGTFSQKPGGFEFLLSDMRSLFDRTDGEYPGLRHVLFGHSMGSVAAAVYPKRFGSVDALILMGAPLPNHLAAAGTLLGKLTAATRGRAAASKFLTRTAEASMGKGNPDPYLRYSWLTRDVDEVQRVIDDALYGDELSASAYSEFLPALREFSAKAWARSVLDIPVYITAGLGDSVGGYGKAPRHYYKNLLDAGHKDARLKLYEDARHELLNELNRQEVMGDIAAYIGEKLA